MNKYSCEPSRAQRDPVLAVPGMAAIRSSRKIELRIWVKQPQELRGGPVQDGEYLLLGNVY